MTVFIDTSAFLGFLNAGDQFHEPAVTQWQELLAGNEQLVTNNYILVETIAVSQHRFGLEAVRVLQNEVFPVVVFHWVDETIHQQAITTLLAARRRRLSLVDCSAMVTMQTLHVKRIFSFDTHYGDYGFDLLPESFN
jgi:uncharacterized protein